ncbi:MAG TPA: amidohydrolase family protein, partial [Gemmatimonadaceae bacterium]|nr:amidohydrolase family protein [Gemmatimonadaceae bacterium]
VHLGMAGREAMPRFLAMGVTSVRDMGGDPAVLRWRDSIAAGAMIGPRVRSAGLIVENARWLTAVIGMMKAQGRTSMVPELERRLGVATAEDAERAIDSLVRLGADFVKVRNAPPPPAAFALLAAARARGLAVVGHAPPFAQLAVTSDSGFRGLEHPVLQVANEGLVEAFSRMDSAGRHALLQRMARNGTAWTPTLVSGRARLLPDSLKRRMVDDTSGSIDVAFRALPPPMRTAWRNELDNGMRDPDTRTDWGAIHRATLPLVREALAAGVPILAGTDMPVIPLVPGYALHDEMAQLVRDAGLTPFQALRAATVTPAEFMGLGAELGQVRPGMR